MPDGKDALSRVELESDVGPVLSPCQRLLRRLLVTSLLLLLALTASLEARPNHGDWPSVVLFALGLVTVAILSALGFTRWWSRSAFILIGAAIAAGVAYVDPAGPVRDALAWVGLLCAAAFLLLGADRPLFRAVLASAPVLAMAVHVYLEMPIALLGAASNGEPVRAHVLLSLGADPNRAAANREPALHAAMGHHAGRLGAVWYEDANGFAERSVIMDLLEHGADVSSVGLEGQTPLHEGARAAHPGIALLIEHGADVNARARQGATPLHWAAYGVAYWETAGTLLAAGADPNAADNDGSTPLHILARISKRTRGAWGTPLSPDAQFAETLLAHGARADVPNHAGETPLSLAEQQGNGELVAILRTGAE